MLIVLMVFMKNVNLCLYPDVNTENAACGCVFANNVNSKISSHNEASQYIGQSIQEWTK